MPVLDPVQHDAHRAGLSLPDGPDSFYIDNDAMIRVDLIIRQIGKECRAFTGRNLLPAVHCAAMSREALAAWVRMGSELWLHLARCTERSLIQRIEILTNRAWRIRWIKGVAVPVFLRGGVLFVGVSFDLAGTCGTPLAAHKSGVIDAMTTPKLK